MTYYTMLSLAPMLMIAIAIAAQVYCTQQVKDEIMGYIRDVASPTVASTVEGLLENTSTPQSGIVAGTISLCILLYGASGIFSQLFDTFNDIWKVPFEKRSGLKFNVRKRLIGVAMVISVGGLLICTLALSSIIASINQFLGGNFPGLTTWLSLADRGLSFIVMPGVLSLIFWYFPAKRLAWSDVWPAACVTSVMLSLSRYLIDIYLRITTASEVYGAAGSLVMLLVWVYLTGMILFLGASLSCAWAKTFGSHSAPGYSDQEIDQSMLKGLRLNLRSRLRVANRFRTRSQTADQTDELDGISDSADSIDSPIIPIRRREANEFGEIQLRARRRTG